MGNLSKLKVAIGQIELVDGQPSRNEAACDRMVDRALDAGADVLAVPYSLTDPQAVRLIGLNDSRIDIAGNVVLLDACGESYRIGLGSGSAECDFSVVCDPRPFTIAGGGLQGRRSAVVVRPVGILEDSKKVLAFDGGSAAYDADGLPFARLADGFEEDFGIVDFGAAPLEPRAVGGAKGLRMLDCLVQTIRRFDRQVLPYGPKWVVGLSGGLDSSVTAALLVLALGAERVVGYNLATRYNTDTTRSNAANLAAALGMPLRNGSIEDLVVSLGNTLVQYGYAADALKGVVLENAQARTRGHLLSTFAALEGGVVVNNGNRVECALGYATLYGDAIGALAPIADLTKVQLFELAHAINARFGFEAVPENLLPVVDEQGCSWQTMPSAELASGQVDPMKWFYHDWLVSRLLGDDPALGATLDERVCSVLEAYRHTRLLDGEVARWVSFYGLDDPVAFADDLCWVVSSIKRAAFKRLQAPPGIAIASPASIRANLDVQTPYEPSVRFNALLQAVRKMPAR